ncbi:adenylate kinase [Nematocida displodere]|uniref:Adenylate kinase n=1 Tax=Nematocida displodere TaxID=1805483 RepID=A0A177EDT3_9MICR|nr:adenylate kinase [Nematocida displodere]
MKEKLDYKLLFVGPPLAGKGTQCKLLSKELGIPHISSGDILRLEMEKDTDLAKMIKTKLSHGEFVSDAIIMELINNAIKEQKRGFILDGYPRTVEQLNSIKFDYDAIVFINTPIEYILDRIEGRLCHPSSGRIYHTRYNPPKAMNLDDLTGEPLIKRDDDRIELVQRRVLDFIEKTGGVIERGLELKKLLTIDGGREKEEVNRDILGALEKLQ